MTSPMAMQASPETRALRSLVLVDSCVAPLPCCDAGLLMVSPLAHVRRKGCRPGTYEYGTCEFYQQMPRRYVAITHGCGRCGDRRGRCLSVGIGGKSFWDGAADRTNHRLSPIKGLFDAQIAGYPTIAEFIVPPTCGAARHPFRQVVSAQEAFGISRNSCSRPSLVGEKSKTAQGPETRERGDHMAWSPLPLEMPSVARATCSRRASCRPR
jgi:hypothetical protein